MDRNTVMVIAAIGVGYWLYCCYNSKVSVNHPRHVRNDILDDKFYLQTKIMQGSRGAMEDYMSLHHDETTPMPREW
jgi:hypothetical protein